MLVDVQNDFISGSLSISDCPAGHNGEEVVPVINALLEDVDFDIVVYTLDWHPSNHISFIDNVNLRTLHSTSEVRYCKVSRIDQNENLSLYSRLLNNCCLLKWLGIGPDNYVYLCSMLQ